MKATEINLILCEMEAEEITRLEALDKLCVLFNVEGQSEQLNCDHEWKVEAFDCYGIPYEQYCEHCGKKEAI